jgi:hypothetical protein
MTNKKSIKDIAGMAQMLIVNKNLPTDMTDEMRSSIAAVTDQIDRLSRNNEDLKALVQQIRGVIGQESKDQLTKPDQA